MEKENIKMFFESQSTLPDSEKIEQWYIDNINNTVLLYMEKEGKDKTVTVKLKGTSFRFFTKANCLNTIKVD